MSGQDLLDVIEDSWSFTPLQARAIIDTNAFGNVLVAGDDGRYWRICPEELSCEPIAASEEELERLRSSPEFKADWEMERLAELGNSLFGRPPAGRCFCLKIPAVLGGAYDASNLATITILELLAASGEIASQIKDLPDGAKVRLKIVD